MKIRFKIIFGYLLIAALLWLVGVIGLTSIRSLSSLYYEFSTKDKPDLLALKDIRNSIDLIHNSSVHYMFIQTQVMSETAKESGLQTELVSISNREANYNQVFSQLKKQTPADDKREIERLTRLNEGWMTFIGLSEEIRTKSDVKGTKSYSVSEEFERATTSLLELIKEEINYEDQEILDIEKKLNTVSRNNFAIIIFLTLSSGVLAVISGILISGAIMKPITKLISFVENVGSAEFNQKVKLSSHDEIEDLAKAFNQMVVRLNKSKKQVDKKVRELGKAKEALELKLAEIQKMNRLMMGRELRMIELKKQIRDLEEQLKGKENKL